MQLVLIKLRYALTVVNSQLSYYTSLQKALQEELLFLQDFLAHQPTYRQYVNIFIQELQVSRRQRALDLDLDVRKANLETFRDARLQSLQLIKQQQLAEELEAQRILEEKLKNRSSTLKKTFKGAIKASRDVKKALNGMIKVDHEMNEEEKRMAKTIRERNKEGLGSRPECIKSLYLTYNTGEYTYFQKQNDHLKSKGLPYFKPMARSIGNQIYLWTASTYDDSTFITDVWLSHKSPESEYKHIFPNKRAFDEVLTHDASDLEIFVKRDKSKTKGLHALYLAYTEKDESDFIINGFQRLEPNLEVFGLPNMTLWMETQEKAKISQLTNTNALIAEITKVRHLLSEQPTNRNLQSLLERLNGRLAEAHAKEVANQVTDPLAYAIELMALDQIDLDALVKIFTKIDSKKNGVLTMEQVMVFLGQPMTPLAREIFTSVDALDGKGYIEFGDFIRAVGTYAFFGKEEVLRFIYIFADTDRTGSIGSSEFVSLIETINPHEKVRTRRAMKEMNLTPHTTVNFEDFRMLNEQFPSLFLPAFLLQNAMRERIMGVDWWFQKLSKYKEVRAKMASEGKYAEEAVAVELERFTNEQDRQKRMNERAKQIEGETNDLRKVVLQARQFWDDVQE